VLAGATLSRAGIPSPRSFMARRPAQLASSAAKSALILKPHRGYHGVGITVAEAADQLPNEDEYPDFVFAQEYLADAKKDLKVFAIGDEVFGVRKQFSTNSFLSSGEPVPLADEVIAMARHCGKAFGLQLYGLDIAEDRDGTYVVDVNYFPGYRGVPNASRQLADYILKAAKG
jgi:ribosomal protein S6--L-glutamate ligase